jgi:hypothetical protein
MLSLSHEHYYHSCTIHRFCKESTVFLSQKKNENVKPSHRIFSKPPLPIMPGILSDKPSKDSLDRGFL